MAQLTDKQRAFVIEYVKDFNATQAAIRAGYSERTARQIGSQNLSKVNIMSEIDKRFEESAMQASETLFHISQIARGHVDGCTISDQLQALELLAKWYNLTNSMRFKMWK